MDNAITVSTNAGAFRAYLAQPLVMPAPVIIVLQEILGVNADLRATCNELAQQGYLAICPDLFWRMEPGVDLSDRSEADWKKGMTLYKAFDYEAGIADVARTIEAARSLPGANGKVGLMGFCLGGLMTFIAAARTGADAFVVYYGGGMETYLDEAGGIRRPILVHLGQEDEYISRQAQKAIIEALSSSDSAKVFTYPGCSHAFARHGGVHYDKDAAALANRRTSDFFRVSLI